MVALQQQFYSKLLEITSDALIRHSANYPNTRYFN